MTSEVKLGTWPESTLRKTLEWYLEQSDEYLMRGLVRQKVAEVLTYLMEATGGRVGGELLPLIHRLARRTALSSGGFS